MSPEVKASDGAARSLPAGKMVHDLLQSLRAILTSAQRLQRMDGLAAEAATQADSIVHAARRQEELLRAIAEFDHAAENPHARQDTLVPLHMALQIARLRVETARVAAGGGIDVATMPGGDVSQVASKVLEKVLHNGLKFRREGSAPAVRVEAEADDSCVVIRVADNGIGVAAAHRERVFLPFTRLNSVSAYPGSALGLATCRLLMESIGGEICFLDPPDGVGALVEVRVPLAQ